jgi:hypothetical protein
MTTCSIVDAGKEGIVCLERVVSVFADVPVGSRRSDEVRTRMRKRPVERKSAHFVLTLILHG